VQLFLGAAPSRTYEISAKNNYKVDEPGNVYSPHPRRTSKETCRNFLNSLPYSSRRDDGRKTWVTRKYALTRFVAFSFPYTIVFLVSLRNDQLRGSDEALEMSFTPRRVDINRSFLRTGAIYEIDKEADRTFAIISNLRLY
jgi:hypothetical protein